MKHISDILKPIAERLERQSVQQLMERTGDHLAAITAYYAQTREDRMTCLAKSLLDQPLSARRRFLADWEKRHGDDMASELKGYMQRLWDERGKG